MAATELDSLATLLLGRVGGVGDGYAATPEPPGTVLLEVLAKNLGAHRVLWERHSPGTEDGMVEVVDDRILIRIRRRGARQRRERFTLAHEIGHLVLAQPDLRLTSMRRRTGLDDAERFCDAFAAALLMPQEWIEREYHQRPHSLETLVDCSTRTETSLAATLLRLRGILGWRSSLLHWRRTGDEWRMIGLTGVRYRLRRELGSTEETRKLLEGLPVGQMIAEIPLAIPSGSVTVKADLLVRSGSIVGLVDLRRVGGALARPAGGIADRRPGISV